MITPRRITLLIASTLLVLALPMLLAPPALAQQADLYVNAAAALGGDGSSGNPFLRITDAVARARGIRNGGSSAQIVIHVAPGAYVGSYTTPGPRIEPLPIRLDVSGLELLGSTLMQRDERGWPTAAIEPGSETSLRADAPIIDSTQLLVVASTNPEAVVERVTIAQLSLDTTNADEGLLVVRAQDFTVRDNYVKGGTNSTAIDIFRSSGQILGNYATGETYGVGIGPGNPSSPAKVVVSGNRFVGNRNAGVILVGSDKLPLPEAALSAVVCGNDLSNNSDPGQVNLGLGLRVFAISMGASATSGSVTATICNNRIRNNNFGVMMDAGFARRAQNFIPDPRLYTGTFHLTFEDNEIAGNIRTPALISFTRFSSSLNPDQLNGDFCAAAPPALGCITNRSII